MFRTTAGGLTFQYIADDDPNNLPNPIDMIGHRPHIRIHTVGMPFFPPADIPDIPDIPE